MDQYEPYGRRDKRSGTIRLIGGLMLGLTVLALTLTLGSRRETLHLGDLAVNGPDGWAINRFRDPVDRLPIPPKKPGVRRLVFISNSHAKTGGMVARHLQKLLDALSPGAYEVLDLAEAGLFAPDMLERGLAALDYQPDVVLLAVAYISFSDRMKLANQSHSARSFVKKTVFRRLPAGFWWRNYDLTLYGDTLVGRFLSLYRYRNDIRNLWEEPVGQYLKRLTGDRAIRSLEVDENQSWKFPTGFDQNLFDWSLYAIGRDGHLADMKALVAACRKAGVPVMAFNLPIDWKKSWQPHDVRDVAAYRQSLKDLYADPVQYTDYQDIFPTAWTSYDPLHPTWHGARLHALDMVSKLNRAGWLGKTYDEDRIVDLFLGLDEPVSPDYRQALAGPFPPLDILRFRRYDFFEPDNAHHLLRELATFPAGSDQDRSMVRDVCNLIGYWRRILTGHPSLAGTEWSASFDRAFQTEMERAMARLDGFEAAFIRLEQEKLAAYPLPELDPSFLAEQRTASSGQAGEETISRYDLPTGYTVTVRQSVRSNRIMIYFIQDHNTGRAYRRIDLLGNGSFVLLEKYVLRK